MKNFVPPLFHFYYILNITKGKQMKRITIYHGTYKGEIFYGIRIPQPNGKEKKRKIGTYEEAVIAAAKLQDEIDASLGIRRVDKVISTKELFLEFIKVKRNISKSSQKRYSAYFASFERFMGPNFPSTATNIKTIQRYHIEEFIEYLLKKEKKALSTINHTVEFLNSLFIYALDEDYILKNPIRKVEKFSIDEEKETDYYTKEELKKIWDNIDPYWVNFLKLLYLTGIRKGELINLTWDRVNLETEPKFITIISSEDFRTKTGKKRRVNLHPRAVEILEGQKGINKKYVFVSRGGNKIHPDKPYHALKTALKKIGIEGHVHKLRSSFASHLVSDGVDLYQIQRFLGHSKPTQSAQYSHLSPASKQSAIEKLKDFE
jgi:integrase